MFGFLRLLIFSVVNIGNRYGVKPLPRIGRAFRWFVIWACGFVGIKGGLAGIPTK